MDRASWKITHRNEGHYCPGLPVKFSNTLDLVWSAHTGSPPSPRPSDESLPGPVCGVDEAEDITNI